MTEPHNPKWLSYQQASEWAQSQNIMNHDQWTERCAAGLPDGVPIDPQTAYGAEFVGWYEFLGVQLSRDGRKVFWSYERARDWARGAGVKTGIQWEQMSKDKVLPIGVPAQPYKVYKGKFKNWGEFLGTGHVATKDKAFMSYEEARSWAKSLNITNMIEWKEKRKEFGSEGIPAHPHRIYKEFTNWGEFLGTGRVANKDREFLSYEEASAWAQEEGIFSIEEWFYRARDGLPSNIPIWPNKFYQNGFRWGKFLNNGKRIRKKISSYKMGYDTEDLLPYKDALHWARIQGICSSAEWRTKCREIMPVGIPNDPYRVYPEFKSWADFLGLKVVHGMSKIERMLRYVLETVFEDKYVEFGQPVITDDKGKKHRVDICLSNLNLIVEYDGAYWHQNKENSDKKKTQALLESNGEWNVVRIRGNPLKILRADWDMCIDESTESYVQIFKVLQHILCLIESKLIKCCTKIFKKAKEVTLQDIKNINFREILENYDHFKSYEEARAWARKEKILTGKEWNKRSKKGLLGKGLPACPRTLYGNQFKGWEDFLGVENKYAKKCFVEYSEASSWAKNNNISTSLEWLEMSKKGLLPKNLPASPRRTYGDAFISNNRWYGFLGKEKTKKFRTKNG